MFRPFTGQNPAGAKSSNSVLLGFSQLFRKFCTAEVNSEVVNSEVVKHFRKSLYSHLRRSKMISWKFAIVRLEIFYYNGDATNEETKVGPKKSYRTSKKVKCSSMD